MTNSSHRPPTMTTALGTDSTAIPPRAPRKLVRHAPRPLALEPRFMFDGAAAGDAAQLLAEAAPTAHLPGPAAFDTVARSTLPASVIAARSAAGQQVAEFLARPNARDQLLEIFGGDPRSGAPAAWERAADALMASLGAGDVALAVEMRPGAELQGALGAFAAQGPQGHAVIYLNSDWVRSGPGDQALRQVLVEEMGHAIDHQLNGGRDSQGDEGQAFVGAVTYGDANLAVTRQIDDHLMLSLDGVAVAAEAAAP